MAGDFAVELGTIVTGAGSGGYVATVRTTEMGQKVAIIERECISGVYLNVGCIPSKALITARHHYQESLNSRMSGVTSENVKLDFARTREWKKNKAVRTSTSDVGSLSKKHKVETIEGEAFFVNNRTLHVIHPDSVQIYSFNNAIIATSLRSIEIPGFKLGGRMLNSTGGLVLKEVSKKFVIIGGGVIDAGLGGVYTDLGAEVTTLEGSPQILSIYKEDLVELVGDDFKEEGVTVVTSVMAKEVVDNGDSVIVKYAVDGKGGSITADHVMVTVGRHPNTDDMGLEQAGVEVGERGSITVDKQGHTNVPNIYAIGDIVLGAALTHKTSYEAKIVAEAISGKKVVVDYKAMPAVAFADPELASVGMTIKETKDAGIEAEAYKFPFSGDDRILLPGKTKGFIRLVTVIEDNVFIGAQISGVGASDMVSELALAIESGTNVEGIALTTHPHPSLGEIVMDASGLVLGLPVHI